MTDRSCTGDRRAAAAGHPARNGTVHPARDGTADAARLLLGALRDSPHRRIIIDLGRVDGLDPDDIRLLLAIGRQAAATATPLALVVPDGPVKDVLAQSALSTLLPSYPSLAACAAAADADEVPPLPAARCAPGEHPLALAARLLTGSDRAVCG